MFPDGTIEAFGLVLARTGALVLSTPILGTGTGFTGYKVGFVFLLSIVLYTAVGEPLPPGVEPIALGVMAVREVLIGVFLGFLLHLVLVAIRVAGEMIGHEMGFMVAQQVDPISGVQSSLITNVYEHLFLIVLLMLNGHHLILRSLDLSFERAPIGNIGLAEGVAPALEGLFGEMFAAGIVFAAPVMILLVLVSILIGLLSRAVPTLNVLEVGFTVRVGIAMLAMFIFAPLLEPAMTGLFGKLSLWLDRGLTALGA